MRLTDTAGSENQNVGGLLNPVSFGGKFLDRDGINLGQVGPLEVGNRFCVW